MTEAKARILVVDDDAGQRGLLATFLRECGYRVSVAASGNEALGVLDETPADMLITDMRMPGISGAELLQEARRRNPELPVLLVTAFADVRDAVEAMRDGASTYLEKPIDFAELLQTIRHILGETGTPATVGGSASRPLPEGVIAESPALKEVLQEAALVAPSDSRVLITGESGTGKEVIAGLIHAWSRRADGPMVKVNCAAIPEALLESELFGHERGAFTGAVGQRIGRFEDADGGTLFLDEVAEMSPGLQAKLLRVIQDGTFQRVGSNEALRTDARVIAATNRNLEDEVAAGRFREDLFYRLNVIELYVPPLRERPEDVLPLARVFAARFAEGATRLSGSVCACLTVYRWPGNVRELQNAIERATLMARGGPVLPEHLPRRIREAIGENGGNPDGEGEGTRMEEMERVLILQTLREKAYNRSETARTLGISRRALIYKLHRYEAAGYDVNG